MTNYARKALENEAENVRLAKVGTRNDTLNKAAFKLGRFTANGYLAAEEIKRTLSYAAAAANLSDSESMRVIDAGIEAGRKGDFIIQPAFTSRQDAIDAVNTIELAGIFFAGGNHQGNRQAAGIAAITNIARSFGGPQNVPLGHERLKFNLGTNSKRKVQLVLKDFQETHWLTQTATYVQNQSPNKYNLHIPTELSQQSNELFANGYQFIPSSCKHEPHYETVIGHVGNDAYQQAALGITGWRILVALYYAQDWCDSAQLRTFLGLARSTIWKYVGTDGYLVEMKLVHRDGMGRVCLSTFVSTETLDDVAMHFGTFGMEATRLDACVARYQARGLCTTEGNWISRETGEIRPGTLWIRGNE